MSVETNKPPSWWEANWEVGLLGTMALDSETKQQIETLFAMLDRDKDGTLTPDEIEQVIEFTKREEIMSLLDFLEAAFCSAHGPVLTLLLLCSCTLCVCVLGWL